MSPNDRQVEIEALLDDLKARRYVQYFVGHWLNSISQEDIVLRCWDVKNLHRQYQAFLARWKPELEACRQHCSTRSELPPSECFVRRFWLIHEYSGFPRRDPILPDELLPEGWPGVEAEQVFSEYRTLLTQRANAFIEETLQNGNG